MNRMSADTISATSKTSDAPSQGMVKKLALPIKWFLVLLIWIYRSTLGIILGGSCRFEPSCSHYAEEALHKHGVLKGLLLTVKRIIKCNPWGPFGPDPVP